LVKRLSTTQLYALYYAISRLRCQSNGASNQCVE
jgi:hypothetical protein